MKMELGVWLLRCPWVLHDSTEMLFICKSLAPRGCHLYLLDHFAVVCNFCLTSHVLSLLWHWKFLDSCTQQQKMMSAVIDEKMAIAFTFPFLPFYFFFKCHYSGTEILFSFLLLNYIYNLDEIEEKPPFTLSFFIFRLNGWSFNLLPRLNLSNHICMVK